MNELKLIEGCLQHNRDCQKSLYDKYSRQMHSICLRYLKEHDMANEALQRGFIKVFEKLESYKATGTLGAWIRTIVVRKCIDLIKEQKGLRYDDLDKLENHEVSWDENGSSYAKIEYSEIVELLDRMPLGYRTVFSMYILDGLKHEEIAGILNITLATSRSQLHKARKMMMDLVKQKLKATDIQKYQS